MSDSLISGQPLNRLYSKFARVRLLSRLRATQAMGSVRLQVTGNPPTVSVWSWSRERKLLRSAFQLTLRYPWRALIPSVHPVTPRKTRRESCILAYLTVAGRAVNNFKGLVAQWG